VGSINHFFAFLGGRPLFGFADSSGFGCFLGETLFLTQKSSYYLKSLIFFISVSALTSVVGSGLDFLAKKVAIELCTGFFFYADDCKDLLAG
jgi:hypothetical protein